MSTKSASKEIIIVFFIFFILIILFGIILYSKETGKTFCEKQGMKMLDIIPERFFDLKNDVICYSLDKSNIDCKDNLCIINRGEMVFYYFER